MSLIPSDLHATALLACGNGSISDGPKVRSAACRQELNRIGDLLIGINKYSILEPCYVGGNPYTGKEHETALIRHPGLRMSGSDTSLTITASTKATLQGAEAVLGPAARAIRLGHTPGCLDSR